MDFANALQFTPEGIAERSYLALCQKLVSSFQYPENLITGALNWFYGTVAVIRVRSAATAGDSVRIQRYVYFSCYCIKLLIACGKIGIGGNNWDSGR